MKLRRGIRTTLAVLVMALMFSAAAPAVLPTAHTAEAAKKKSAKVNLKINTEMTTVKVGKSATLKVSGNAKKKVKWSTTSSCVKLSKKSGTKIKVKGVKEGVAAVIAKVGSSKVVCCVYVGKATYSQASSKTKKALGNPIKLLASYVAKHPVSAQTGNTETDKASWEGRCSNNTVYSLTVQGANLVVSANYSYTYQYTGGGSSSSTESTTMYVPVSGDPTATITYNYDWTDIETDGTSSTGKTTYSFAFNINTITPGTEISYQRTRTYSDGSTYTSDYKRSFYNASGYMVDVLHCFLVDNSTGFTAKDIGFSAYPATHRNVGLLTSSDMAAFGAQMASLRAYEQAHYTEDDD